MARKQIFPNEDTTVVNIVMPKELKAAIDQAAQDEHRTISGQISVALREWLARREGAVSVG